MSRYNIIMMENQQQYNERKFEELKIEIKEELNLLKESNDRISKLLEQLLLKSDE